LQDLSNSGEITYSLSNMSFYLQLLDTPQNLEDLCDDMYLLLTKLEKNTVNKIDYLYELLTQAGTNLQQSIEHYFTSEEEIKPEVKVFSESESKLRLCHNDMRIFLRGNEELGSARVVARIMHGLASPAFPASHWRSTPFWSHHKDIPFEKVLQIAEEEVRFALNTKADNNS